MLFAPGKASVPRGPRDCPRIGPEGNLEGPPTDALTQTFLSKLYQNCSSFRQFFVANGAWQIGACKNAYLIFVTDTTDMSVQKKIAQGKFLQILREKVAFFTDLTRKIGVFWCEFYSPKSLPVFARVKTIQI